MSYRLLMPSREPLFPRQIEAALGEFDVFRTSDMTPTWSITDMSTESGDGRSGRLSLSLLRDDALVREADERYFLRPDGANVWLEVRTVGAAEDRASRLSARLCAMTLAAQLELPVLETRNGVYCKTPEAFTAWCSRQTHPDTMLMGSTEHRTTLPSRRMTVARPEPVVATRPEPVASRANAPLPHVPWYTDLWRRWLHLRTYIVSVPPGVERKVLEALVQEITATFGDRNVYLDAPHDRLLIVGKDSPGTSEVIAYYRRRAHPERLRIAAATAR